MLSGGFRLELRVSYVNRSSYRVIADNDEIPCKLKGIFSKNGFAKSDFPVVGDFVLVDEHHVITDVLPRKNKITRKAAGKKVEEQIFAANIDCAFVITSLNDEFNIRRLERYATFLDLQNIPHCVVLTKSDLCTDINHFINQMSQISSPIIITSIVNGSGIDEIKKMLTPGSTSIFLGSSGVGKSSLVNYLLEDEAMKTGEIRGNDAKGKHTTTHRELFILPNAAAIIDSPGMRELQLWIGGDDMNVFNDIEEFAARCKFRNCSHASEPGCAVKDAINMGLLTEKRLKSYLKLKREAHGMGR